MFLNVIFKPMLLGRNKGHPGGGDPKNSQIIYSTGSYLHTLGQSAFLHTYCTCTVY